MCANYIESTYIIITVHFDWWAHFSIQKKKKKLRVVTNRLIFMRLNSVEADSMLPVSNESHSMKKNKQPFNEIKPNEQNEKKKTNSHQNVFRILLYFHIGQNKYNDTANRSYE